MQPAQQHGREKLDGIAILLSGTCLVHCLALPILVTLFPIAQGSMLDEARFHVIILLFIIPTSLIALTIGCRKHKDKLTVALGVLGLLTLALTALFGHDLLGAFGERVVTNMGGIILAGAHIQNYRCCRAKNCNHTH